MEQSDLPFQRRESILGKITLIETNVKLDKIIKSQDKLVDYEEKLGVFASSLEKAKKDLKKQISSKLERSDGIEYLAELTGDKDTAIYEKILEVEENLKLSI